MREYKFIWAEPISETSTKAINSGQIPRIATIIKTFASNETGALFSTTDLDIKKCKRKHVFNQFFDTYISLYLKKNVTILTGVFNLNKYPNIGSFISDFKKKLKRKNIEIYGYIWCRDFEEKKWREHVHVYIATSIITPKEMKDLFSKKKHTDYNFCFPKKTLKAAIEYLKNKELYAPRRMRTFSKSQNFLKPKLNTK